MKTQSNNKSTKLARLVFAVLIFTMSLGAAHAQSGNSAIPPTDAPGLPYSVDEMVTLIQSSIEAPNDTNAYVQMVLQVPTFPALQLGQPLSQNQISTLQSWVTNNPDHIEDLLIARKENYDFYYGPSSGGTSN